MCAPNYERDFIGWTIRTMLRVAREKSLAAVSVVNEAFRADIETIISQKKRDVYKNEIKLIVRLGNKINPGLVFGSIVTEAETPAAVQLPVMIADEIIPEDNEEENNIDVDEAPAETVHDICDESPASNELANELSEQIKAVIHEPQMEAQTEPVSLSDGRSEIDKVVDARLQQVHDKLEEMHSEMKYLGKQFITS